VQSNFASAVLASKTKPDSGSAIFRHPAVLLAGIFLAVLASCYGAENHQEPGMNNTWRKSSFSTNNGACVEVDGSRIRDSKDPHGAVLTFTPDEWRAFIAGVKAGEFDIPQLFITP
jgi:Domain of unknown function (DUF397)